MLIILRISLRNSVFSTCIVRKSEQDDERAYSMSTECNPQILVKVYTVIINISRSG